MKNILFISLLFSSIFVRGQWIQQNSNTIQWLNDVYFLDDQNGFAVGDDDYPNSGTYLKTVDGGVNWISEDLGVAASFEEIFFVNQNVGYIVGENDIFLKTINGGVSWSVDTVANMFNWLKTCYFISPDTGWVAGTYGEVYYTQDGGSSWEDRSIISPSSGSEVSYIHFFDKDNGIATGSSIGTFKTDDGGVTWDTLAVNHKFSSFHFINDSIGYANYFLSRDIAKTTNQGTTWQVFSGPVTSADYRAIYFTNDSTGYSLGYGQVLKTSTSGTYTEEQYSNASLLELESVHFPSDSIGYAVGKSGLIVKTTNAGGATIPDAVFSASQTLVCVGDTVWFNNNSVGNNTYEWFVNGNSFSTTYNSFYSFNTPETSFNISLVAYNGTYYDTSTVIINTDSSLIFNIIASKVVPVYCQGESVQFKIDSSLAYVSYQLKVDGNNIGIAQFGNGGVLLLNAGNIDTTTIFTICGTISNNCGTASYCVNDTVVIVPNANPSTPVFSTDTLICISNTAQIEIQNTQLGYTYELLKNGIPTGITNSGNNNSIYLNTSSLMQDANFQVEVTNSVGCKNLLSTSVQIKIDSVVANFNANPINLFVNDTIFITNNSMASSYQWTFDISANNTFDTVSQPFVYYNSIGEKQIKLLVYSSSGCVDSSFTSVNIYDYASQSNGSYCFFDTISQVYPFYYDSGHILDYHVDYKGNTYVGGRFADNWGTRKDCMFLKKFDKNGVLKWEEAQSVFNNSFSNYKSSYVTGITTDENLNVYITGSYSAVNFTMDGITINHSFSENKIQSYIAKLDSNGQTQWIIHTDIASTSAKGGTDIVCNNENQIFVSLVNTSRLYFPDGSNHYFPNGNFILEIDKNGNHKNSYPINNYLNTNSYASFSFLNTSLSSTYTWLLQSVSPKLEISRDGKLYVFGKYANGWAVGGLNLTPIFSNPPNTNNVNTYVAILDTALGWQSAFTLYGRSWSYLYDNPTGIYPVYALDEFNNIYITESMKLDYWGDSIFIVFNNGDTLIGGNHSMFSKFDNQGNLIWHTKNLDIDIRGIESFSNEEIILYGEYLDFMGIYSSNNELIGNSSNGSKDLAIISIDSNGIVNWIDNLGSKSADIALFSEKNECGELYFLGNLQDTTITNYGTLNNNSYNLFTLHFSHDANCIYECEPEIPCNSIANYTFINNGNGNYSFTNTSTGSYNKSHWAFGDGGTSTAANPNHTFSANGTYVVVLTVNDSTLGSTCIDYYLDTIVVTGVVAPLQCAAGFVMYPDTTINNVIVVNSSTGSNLTYLWDFGDGNTSNAQFPTHTYATTGNYYLCLTVDDGAGCVDMYCDSIGQNGVVFNKQTGFTINVIAPPLATQVNEQTSIINGLTIYPNPSSGIFIIEHSKENIPFIITDISGRVINTGKLTSNKTNIDLSKVQKGVYLLKIGEQTTKLIRQ
ncbi:MAG TPA: PKD domain-containing protein [Vicingus sp.]|nr:PKD domain-containing protein [Vicingus sp.]